jgi:predicted nucleotide-binding protein (sugar kinase/HSP70/actin superfamily)
MCLYNQTIPYELNKGDAKALVERWTQKLLAQMETPLFVRLGRNYRAILKDFAAVAQDRSVSRVKVGIVGEIYLKYAPLGNNGLEEYLAAEGCEVVNSGLIDFVMYCVFNRLYDRELYGHGGPGYTAYYWASRFLVAKQRQMVRAIKKHGVFTAPARFERVAEMSEGYIGHGVKMGEGWLLTAEMLELIHSGVNNIVSAQPFGCLPNHIVAKGMIRKIKDNYPFANIIAVDYDPGASRINQENRIKLMLANARRRPEPAAPEYEKAPAVYAKPYPLYAPTPRV